MKITNVAVITVCNDEIDNKHIINIKMGIPDRIKEDHGYIIIKNNKNYYMVFTTELPSNVIKKIKIHYYKIGNKVEINEINIINIYNIYMIREIEPTNYNLYYDIINKICIIKIEKKDVVVKPIIIDDIKDNILKFEEMTNIFYYAYDKILQKIKLTSIIKNLLITNKSMALMEELRYFYDNNTIDNKRIIGKQNILLLGNPVFDKENNFLGVIYDDNNIIPSNIIKNNILKIEKKNMNYNISPLLKDIKNINGIDVIDNKVDVNGIKMMIKTYLSFYGDEYIKIDDKIERLEEIEKITNIEDIIIKDGKIKLNEELFNLLA